MSVVDVLMLTCLLLMLILYTWTVWKLRRTICGFEESPPPYLGLIHIASTALPILAMCAAEIPLPVFYLLLYAAACLLEFAARKRNPWEWLFINVRFLIFAVTHLIVVGVMALCAETDVVGLLGDRILRVLSLTIVLSLNAALVAALARGSRSGRLRTVHWSAEELQLFSRFVWFCVCSVCFDSIPCLFSLPDIFPLIFLIGSNLLLLLMVFLFAHHVYTIMRDSYVKEEALRLWEEAMEQHIRTVQLERSAHLDVLTKAYTRRYALTNMSSMLASGEEFTLAFLDLDRLKQINDRDGHLAGDEYLQFFTSRMRERLRPNDIFARYGGDEFLILMPDMGLETANARLVQIQSDASAVPPGGWGAPFSFGLAAARPGGELSADELISIADRAMYENKERRREEWGES